MTTNASVVDAGMFSDLESSGGGAAVPENVKKIVSGQCA
jgi:hypothetical protein